MRELGPEIPKFASAEDAMKVIFAYWTFCLPFMKIDFDVFSVPFITRDYLKMKLKDAREKSAFFYLFIPIVILANLTCNPLLWHL